MMALAEITHFRHTEEMSWVKRGYDAGNNTGAPSAGNHEGRLWRIGVAAFTMTMRMPVDVRPFYNAFRVDNRLVTVASDGTVKWDAAIA